MASKTNKSFGCGGADGFEEAGEPDTRGMSDGVKEADGRAEGGTGDPRLGLERAMGGGGRRERGQRGKLYLNYDTLELF